MRRRSVAQCSMQISLLPRYFRLWRSRTELRLVLHVLCLYKIIIGAFLYFIVPYVFMLQRTCIDLTLKHASAWSALTGSKSRICFSDLSIHVKSTCLWIKLKTITPQCRTLPHEDILKFILALESNRAQKIEKLCIFKTTFSEIFFPVDWTLPRKLMDTRVSQNPHHIYHLYSVSLCLVPEAPRPCRDVTDILGKQKTMNPVKIEPGN